MLVNQTAYITFCAQVTDKDVAEYFCDQMLESGRGQKHALMEIVRFAMDKGFKVSKREVKKSRNEEAKERRLKRLKLLKKQVRK